MALDRQLSRDFWLHEFTGWEHAREDEVAQLRETVNRVLQPLRTHMGVPVIPSSWLYWSDGTPRTGAHAHGAVDFVVADGRTREAFDWGAVHLVPNGYIGRWIYEPRRSASEGIPQGEHVHLAPVVAMLALNGDPTIEVLEETTEGNYKLARVATASLGAGALVLLALFFFRCVAGAGRRIVECIPGLAAPMTTRLPTFRPVQRSHRPARPWCCAGWAFGMIPQAKGPRG